MPAERLPSAGGALGRVRFPLASGMIWQRVCSCADELFRLCGLFSAEFELGLELDSAEVRGVLIYQGQDWGRVVFDYRL